MGRQPVLLIAALGIAATLAACGSSGPAGDATALADKEAELAQREAELAEREAALQAQVPAAAAPAEVAPPAPAAAPKPVATKPPATSKPAPAAPPAAPKPPPAPARVVTVPEGTVLALSLATPLSTKTAKVGDTVRATIVEPISVDGRTAIASGTTVAGQVIKVVSGSDKIGGVPTLALYFDRLELPGNVDVPLSGEITQSGKSDTGRDVAKIVGGAAAGAIIGGEVKKGDKGKVIGGLLGGAIGAVAAQKTGTEVQLAEGTALSLTLAAPIDITK